MLWAKERVDSDLYSWCYNDNLILLQVIFNTRHGWFAQKTGLGCLIATREVYICRELVA